MAQYHSFGCQLSRCFHKHMKTLLLSVLSSLSKINQSQVSGFISVLSTVIHQLHVCFYVNIVLFVCKLYKILWNKKLCLLTLSSRRTVINLCLFICSSRWISGQSIMAHTYNPTTQRAGSRGIVAGKIIWMTE